MKYKIERQEFENSMKNTVYKYQLHIDNIAEVIMPVGAKILTVQAQHDVPHIWALVNPEEKQLEARYFRFAGTGHIILQDRENLQYIGSFQMRQGRLVFHIFEIKQILQYEE